MSSSIIYQIGEAWVRVWEELNGIQARQLTSDWPFVEDLTVSMDESVETTKQIGSDHDKDEITGHSGVLTIGSWQDENAFTLASSNAIQYWIEIYMEDSGGAGNTTITLKHCRPSRRNISGGDLNTVGREWKIGAIS